MNKSARLEVVQRTSAKKGLKRRGERGIRFRMMQYHFTQLVVSIKNGIFEKRSGDLRKGLVRGPLLRCVREKGLSLLHATAKVPRELLLHFVANTYLEVSLQLLHFVRVLSHLAVKPNKCQDKHSVEAIAMVCGITESAQITDPNC